MAHRQQGINRNKNGISIFSKASRNLLLGRSIKLRDKAEQLVFCISGKAFSKTKLEVDQFTVSRLE
jgi:hypothetical protein